MLPLPWMFVDYTVIRRKREQPIINKSVNNFLNFEQGYNGSMLINHTSQHP